MNKRIEKKKKKKKKNRKSITSMPRCRDIQAMMIFLDD